jgi:hypothetical protein
MKTIKLHGETGPQQRGQILYGPKTIESIQSRPIKRGEPIRLFPKYEIVTYQHCNGGSKYRKPKGQNTREMRISAAHELARKEKQKAKA